MASNPFLLWIEWELGKLWKSHLLNSQWLMLLFCSEIWTWEGKWEACWTVLLNLLIPGAWEPGLSTPWLWLPWGFQSQNHVAYGAENQHLLLVPSCAPCHFSLTPSLALLPLISCLSSVFSSPIYPTTLIFFKSQVLIWSLLCSKTFATSVLLMEQSPDFLAWCSSFPVELHRNFPAFFSPSSQNVPWNRHYRWALHILSSLSPQWALD